MKLAAKYTVFGGALILFQAVAFLLAKWTAVLLVIFPPYSFVPSGIIVFYTHFIFAVLAATICIYNFPE